MTKQKVVSPKEKRVQQLQKAIDYYNNRKKLWEGSSDEPSMRNNKLKPSIRATAKRFNVNYYSLRRRLNCGVAVDAHAGRPTHFTVEEKELKEWIFAMSDSGFAIKWCRTE